LTEFGQNQDLASPKSFDLLRLCPQSSMMNWSDLNCFYKFEITIRTTSYRNKWSSFTNSNSLCTNALPKKGETKDELGTLVKLLKERSIVSNDCNPPNIPSPIFVISFFCRFMVWIAYKKVFFLSWRKNSNYICTEVYHVMLGILPLFILYRYFCFFLVLKLALYTLNRFHIQVILSSQI